MGERPHDVGDHAHRKSCLCGKNEDLHVALELNFLQLLKREAQISFAVVELVVSINEVHHAND